MSRWASSRRATPRQFQPVPLGFSPGDARGEAPCIRKLKIPPFPEGGRGAGGWGQKSSDTAGKSGEQNRRAPAGCGFRPLFRCPAGQASRRATPTQVQPAPPGFSPGDARGEAPCIRKQKSPPSPKGEGGRGDGGRKAAKVKKGRQPNPPPPTKKQATPNYLRKRGIALWIRS